MLKQLINHIVTVSPYDKHNLFDSILHFIKTQNNSINAIFIRI